MNCGKFLYRQEKLEGGWEIIHVLDSGVIVGRIARDPKGGKFRFFAGSDNSVSFEFEHADIAALKALIESTPWTQRP